MRNHFNVFFQRYAACEFLLLFVLRHELDRAVDKRFIWPVPQAELWKLWPAHKPLDVPHRFFARVSAQPRLAAHDDRLFGASIDAKTTKHTAKHVDVEPRR